MLQLKRRGVPTQPVARGALAVVLMLSLAAAGGSVAQTTPEAGSVTPMSVAQDAPLSAANGGPDTPGAATPAAVRHRPAKRLTLAQSLDESVGRLTRGLDLDPGQQESLRQILVDQHRRIMKLRSANSAAPTDATGTMLAIYDQTKARIRAMLNDEQKKKYSADVPREDLAPAQADLKHWMGLQESKRRQDHAEGDTK